MKKLFNPNWVDLLNQESIHDELPWAEPSVLERNRLASQVDSAFVLALHLRSSFARGAVVVVETRPTQRGCP